VTTCEWISTCIIACIVGIFTRGKNEIVETLVPKHGSTWWRKTRTIACTLYFSGRLLYATSNSGCNFYNKNYVVVCQKLSLFEVMYILYRAYSWNQIQITGLSQTLLWTRYMCISRWWYRNGPQYSLCKYGYYTRGDSGVTGLIKKATRDLYSNISGFVQSLWHPHSNMLQKAMLGPKEVGQNSDMVGLFVCREVK
jgi:hypothetical protein